MTEDNAEPLGIVAGGGALPAAVAEAAMAAGRPVHVVAIRGNADAALEAYPHTWLSWVEIGDVFQTLRKHGCRDVVIVGGVERPDPADMRLGLRALKSVPLVIRFVTSGDGSILSSVVSAFEDRGFTVRGAQEIAPHLVMGAGPLGRVRAGRQDQADIELAFDLIRTLDRFDVGQAVVVSQGHVLAIEAAEGTDAMLERCAGLGAHMRRAASKRTGVLVKLPKPGQERRVDLPTIGPRTVVNAARAGLAGIALAAGEVLVAERERVIREADREGLFVVGRASGAR